MKVVTHGYKYRLNSGNVLNFCSASAPYEATTEELLLVLTDRLEGQYKSLPCMENFLARKALADALRWLATREGKRKILKVTGTKEPHVFPPPNVQPTNE